MQTLYDEIKRRKFATNPNSGILISEQSKNQQTGRLANRFQNPFKERGEIVF